MNIATVKDDQEYQGFRYFRYQLAPELAEAMKSSFWNSLILQTSQQDLAIRHGVIALGALGERLRINNVLTLDNEEANKRHDFACSQYCKAIQELRMQLCSESEHSTRITLLSCFLFICFEFLQGNDNGVLAHLRSGLNILRRSQINPFRIESTCHLRVTVLSQDFAYNVMQLFGLLDSLAALWLGLPSYQNPIVDDCENFFPVPEKFLSLQAAEESLFRHINQIYYLRDRSSARAKSALFPQMPDEAIIQQQFLFSQSEQWLLRLEALLISAYDALTVEGLHRITIMRTNHKASALLLAVIFEPNEESFFAKHDASFEQIVSFSTSLLRPINVMLDDEIFPTSRQMFSFVEGIIQPLYFTAVNCRNSDICWKAVSLLSNAPWREGAWDSTAMAKIAARKLREREIQADY